MRKQGLVPFFRGMLFYLLFSSGWLYAQKADTSGMAITARSVTVTPESRQDGNLQQIYSSDYSYMPNPSGTIETLVKWMPGVSSNNELSSQYSVRGGSFDENLVYVNDIEIYKPFLIRSGQQEGLTFVNPDMVSSVKFSSGGFDASYGDKMASVLDVAYRKPEERKIHASMSLLSGSLSAEGLALGQKLTYIVGYRYKSSRYLLHTLDEEGDYRPRFNDLQAYVTYRLHSKWDIQFLGYLSDNHYTVIPSSRLTSFGTLTDMHELKMYYDGREEDRYTLNMGALTFQFVPSDRLRLKWTVSATSMVEREFYDIENSYLLSGIETSSQSVLSDSVMHVGVGSEWQHARNRIKTDIWTAQHTGRYIVANGLWRWSVSWQNEQMDETYHEWAVTDSAGYVQPSQAALQGKQALSRNRVMGYLQYTHRWESEKTLWHATLGLRMNYNDVNEEWIWAPRASVSLYPLAWPRFSFHLAGGIYHQPPFYKEMRDRSYALHTDIQAQRATHLTFETDYEFEMWDRPFKLTAAWYYKILDRLIPYKVENVRMVYAGDNLSEGYARGLDLKLNGEFVPGAESWLSVSWMKTREDVWHDGYGSFPRPMDQRLNFNLFFQDYFPGNDTWRMHLNLVYGTALPYAYPDENRFDKVFRMRPYRRVDIGLSKHYGSVAFFDDVVLSLEVFNLFDMRNTVSYLWASTVATQDQAAQQFAVPNYLTSRRLNIKIQFSL